MMSILLLGIFYIKLLDLFFILSDLPFKRLSCVHDFNLQWKVHFAIHHSSSMSFLLGRIYSICMYVSYKNGAKEFDPYHPYFTLISLDF